MQEVVASSAQEFTRGTRGTRGTGASRDVSDAGDPAQLWIPGVSGVFRG